MKIGQAHLLQRRYARVTIPTAVAVELDRAESLQDGWRGKLDFVQEMQPAGDDVFRLLMPEVDVGERPAVSGVLREVLRLN